MTWHRVSKEHWQNSSDKHLFYDAEAKLICTEAYPTEPGLSMVVIPKDVLEEMMKENRYYLFPEAEFLAIQRVVDRTLDGAYDNQEDIKWLQDALHRRECKTNSLTQLLMSAEDKFGQALNIVEADHHQMYLLNSQIKKLQAALKVAEENKLKIIEIGGREINALKEEVKRLKEKCGEI